MRLPEFVIIGAMKSGTNSVAGVLRDHPQVFMPKGEAHFFDRHWDQGLDHYGRLFEEAPDGARCGEKTPAYVARERWMRRMASVIPDVRLILLLRDPARRLLSHINMNIDKGHLPAVETITADWLRAEFFDRPGRFNRYVARGFYKDQIEKNVLTHFPRTQLFIRPTDTVGASIDPSALEVDETTGKLSGTLRSDAYSTLVAEVCSFIDIEPPESAELTIRGVRRRRFDVADDAIEFLHDAYGPKNEELFVFLGERFVEWTADSPRPA